MTRFRRAIRRFSGLFAVAAVLAVAACAEKPSLLIDRLQVSAAPRANDDTPVAVDLVLVHEEALVEQLLALTATDWFGKREQMRRDHPEGLTLYSWEVVPDQILVDEIVGERAAWAGIIFTSYRTPGAHRLRLAPGGVTDPIRLRLEETSAVLQP